MNGLVHHNNWTSPLYQLDWSTIPIGLIHLNLWSWSIITTGLVHYTNWTDAFEFMELVHHNNWTSPYTNWTGPFEFMEPVNILTIFLIVNILNLSTKQSDRKLHLQSSNGARNKFLIYHHLFNF